MQRKELVLDYTSGDVKYRVNWLETLKLKHLLFNNHTVAQHNIGSIWSLVYIYFLDYTANTEILDPDTLEWFQGPPLPNAMKEMAVIQNGEQLLSAGGYGSGKEYSGIIEANWERKN